MIPVAARDALDPRLPISVVQYAATCPFADPPPFWRPVQLRLPYGGYYTVSARSGGSTAEPRKPEPTAPLNRLRGREPDCQNPWSAWRRTLAVLESCTEAAGLLLSSGLSSWDQRLFQPPSGTRRSAISAWPRGLETNFHCCNKPRLRW